MSVDATKVQFSSNLSIDKIVCLLTGKFNVTGDTTVLSAGLNRYAIPHKFGRPLFVELLWGVNGVASIDGGSLDSSGNTCLAYSDSNNIYILAQNILGSMSATVTYKVIGSWIDDYNRSIPITPTINTTGKTFFDSRQNYQKIFMQDKVTLNQNNQFNVTHNLNYLPNIKLFFEAFPGEVWPPIAGGSKNFWLYDFASQFELSAIVTTTQLQLYPTTGISGTVAKCWYKIYVDS